MKKLQIQGKGPVGLSSKDFVASGGEGEIYAKGSVAYKVYSDPKKMLALGKIQELAALTHPNIIKPEDVLADEQGKSVGYTMRFVKDTHALCQMFTKSFRDRNGITPDMSLKLVRDLQNIVRHVHDKKILIVDLNEMNFLTSQDFKEIYSIDVDSFQTKNFPATALMESVRDRHASKFSEGTDWFAFAIVSFQMLIGIHPYKGKHSSFKTLDERMKHNISVLNGSVAMPACCLPLSVIPPNYMEWYKAVLEKGTRVPPPDGAVGAVVMTLTTKQLVGSDHFDIQEIEVFASNVLDYFYHGSARVAVTSKDIHFNQDHIPMSQSGIMVTTPKHNTPVFVSLGPLTITNLTTRKEIASLSQPASAMMKSGNRLYFKTNGAIMEASWYNESYNGKDLSFAWNVVANILDNATQMFQGVAFQNLLGATWLSIFPEAGSHVQIRMKELDDYKIVDARYEDGVLMVVTAKKGKYDKHIFRLAEDNTYDQRTVTDITPAGLNFVVLDSGVCVHITEDEKVELFSAKKDSAALTVVDDKEISGDMKLFKQGNKVLFARDRKVFSMTMKKK